MNRKIVKKTKKEYYWCPHPDHIWCAAELTSRKDETLSLVLLDDQKSITIAESECIPIEDPSVMTEDVNDLISLSQVNDATILNSSRIRFMRKAIYTSIGAVLMALNPFETIEGLYGPAKINEYRHIKDEELPAHVYLIPARAYSAMCSFGKNQSLLISGESGAGKTEATKQCLDYLTRVSGGGRHVSTDVENTEVSQIASRIIAASPILEAFGNAQTIRNPNSSRFGKWMELIFSQDNVIQGSKITSYLLEKSRVTQRDIKERNYHVFYQILRGGSEDMLRDIHLFNRPNSTDYKYLCQGSQEAKDLNDADNFEEMFDAFLDMGFEPEVILEIFRVVGAVLVLGNIDFDGIDEGESSEVNTSSDESRRSFAEAAEALGVSAGTLGQALCTRTFQSGGMRKSITTVRLNTQKALETRDSLARNLYDKIFEYIITQINENNKCPESSKPTRMIGLLDIFGFEIFEVNSFEQLCINYCNEMLQNHFNFVIFITETKLYEAEEIECESILFKPNDPVIAKIEECFKSLDEEARIPRGSSKTWFDKMKRLNIPAIKDSDQILTFSIQKDSFNVSHYAGPVTYIPNNFMEKNTETLSNDLVGAMISSSNPLVGRIFSTQSDSVDHDVSPEKSGMRKTSVRSSVPSLSKGFQTQLASLMGMLRSTESHFVRCIKSSSRCIPRDFEAPLVHRQLLYSGVFEVVKIQQSGLPFRLKHEEFIDRYRCLLPEVYRWPHVVSDENEYDSSCQLAQKVVSTIQGVHSSKVSFLQVGRTMVFMKGNEFRFLENEKEILELGAADTIKKWCRSCRIRKIFKRIRDCTRAYDSFVSDCDLENAENSIIELKSHCHCLNTLSYKDILLHIVTRETNYLEMLRKQQAITQNIAAILDDGKRSGPLTSNDVQTLRNQISAAHEMNFVHDWVTAASNMLEKLQMAEDSVNRIQTSTDLTGVQLQTAITTLAEYKSLVEGAEAALLTAETRLRDIEKEVAQYVPDMCKAVESSIVYFDTVSGKLEPQNLDSVDDIENTIGEIDQSNLRSKECRALLTFCGLLVECRSNAAADDSDAVKESLQIFDNVANSLIGTDCSDEPQFMNVIRPQFKLYKHWVAERNVINSLDAVLSIGNIRKSVSLDFIAETHDIEHILSEARENNERPYSVCATNAIEIAGVILDIRHLFNRRSWDELINYLPSISPHLVDIMQCRYPLAVQEVDNCRWLAKYYLTLSELRTVCITPCFSLLDFESGDWSLLTSDIKSGRDIIQTAKEMNLDESKFTSMLDLADKSLNIRRLMQSESIPQSKELLNAIEHHPARTQVPEYGVEIRFCSLLLQIQECGIQLRNALSGCAVYWKLTSAADVEVLVQEKGIEDLSVALSAVRELPRCPRNLLAQAEEAERILLKARKLILEINKEDAQNGILNSISRPENYMVGNVVKPLYRSPLHELKSVDGLQLTIQQLSNASRTSLSRSNVAEVDIVISDLKRRKLSFLFQESISCRCISGSVGNVQFHMKDMEYASSLHTSTCSDLEKDITIVRDFTNIPDTQSVDTFCDNFFRHVLELRAMSSAMISIRQAVQNSDWDAAAVLCETKKDELKDFFEANDELLLVQNEVAHMKLIKAMREALTTLEISTIPNTHKFNPTPSLIHFSLLTNALASADTVGCHNDESMGLKKICISVVDCLKLIKLGRTHEVSLLTMQSVVQDASERDLNSDQMVCILSYVRSHQIVHSLYVAAKNSTDTRSLFLVILKAKAACAATGEEDILRWIQAADDLRNLRVLRKQKDWLGVIHHTEEMDATIRAISPYSDEEKDLISYLNDQRMHSLKEAIAAQSDVQLSIVSRAGKVGSRGTSSFYAPPLGVQMLRTLVEKIDDGSLEDSDFLPETIDNKRRMKSLLNLRESVLNEASVSSVSLRRASSSRGDISQDSEKSKPVRLDSSNSARLAAARERTSQVLEEMQKFTNTAHFALEERAFVSETSKLSQLVETLEEAAAMPVVGWGEDNNEVEFNVENAQRQQEISQHIASQFPHKVSGIALITVVSELQNLLSIAQSNSDYCILDKSLNAFSSLLQIADISPKVLHSLQEQVLVFQRGHLLDQLSALATEGCKLLEVLCFKRQVLDDYLTKTTYLVNATGEQSVPLETMSCIRCMRCARELCWASELQMGAEFKRFKKELDKEAEVVPDWFHDKLLRWVNALPVPQHIPLSRKSIMCGSGVANAASEQWGNDVVINKNLPGFRDLSFRRAHLHFTLQNIGKCIAYMASRKSTPEFSKLQIPFMQWKNRVHMLNTLWRGLYCMTEDWVTPYVLMGSPSDRNEKDEVGNSIMPAAKPVFHSDVHAINILCELLKKNIPHEENLRLQKLVGDIERCFERVLNLMHPFVNKNFTVPKRTTSILRYKSKVKDTGADTTTLKNHQCNIDETLNVFDFCRKCIEVLYAVNTGLERLYRSTVSFRLGFADSGTLYFLKGSVTGVNKVKISILEVVKNWHVLVEGDADVINDVCGCWNGPHGTSALSEILSALHSGSSSRSRLVIRIRKSGKYYLLNIQTLRTRAVMQIFDPALDSAMTISSSVDFYYTLRSNTKAVKMICIAADKVHVFIRDSLDPTTAFTVQEILGRSNTGNANNPLSKVLITARANIAETIKMLEQKCALLLLTQLGYCLPNYSPWSMQWIERDIIKEAKQIAVNKFAFTQTRGLLERDILQALVESTDAVYNAADEYTNTASIFFSQVDERYSCTSSVDLQQSIDGDDDISAMMEAPKLFKQLVRRRSSVKGIDCIVPSLRNRRHSVTDVPLQIVPAVPSSAGWDFTHQLAHSTIVRFVQSKGLFRYFVDYLTSYCSAIEPYQFPTFAHCPPSSKLSKDFSVASAMKVYIDRITRMALHPDAANILRCLKTVYSFVYVMNTVDMCTETIYHGVNGIKAISSAIVSLLSDFEEVAAEYSPADELITSANEGLEEILCKLEFVRRAYEVMVRCVHALTNSCVTSLSISDDESVESVDEYMNQRFSHPADSKRMLSPIVDPRWMDFMKMQTYTVALILKQRHTSAEMAISETVSVCEEELESPQERLPMIEGNVLPRIVAHAVSLEDANLRLHILKEVAVVSMRGARAGVEEKVVELAKLCRTCSCDFYALHQRFKELGLTDYAFGLGGGSERSSVPDGNGDMTLSTPIVNFVSGSSQDLSSFITKLDSVLNSLTRDSDDMGMCDSDTADPLSPEELRETVSEILSCTSNLRALTSTDSKKFVSKSTANASSPGEFNAESSRHDTPGYSVIRMLTARIVFVGHLKYVLQRIVRNIQKGVIEACSEHYIDDTTYADEAAVDDNNEDKGDSLVDTKLPTVPFDTRGEVWQADVTEFFTSAQRVSPDKYDSSASSLVSSSKRTLRSSKNSASSLNPTYSVAGLGRFLLALQRLYASFMDVRLQFQENQDQNAIMKSASFLSELEEFNSRFKILELSSIEQTDTSKRNVADFDRSDMAVVSFLNLPSWICPRTSLVEACVQMKEEALYARDSSMITEFHRRLVAALNIYSDTISEMNLPSSGGHTDESLVNTASGGCGGDSAIPECAHEGNVCDRLETFIEKYAANKAAVDALSGLVVKPPISSNRELPPDTEELLERAKLVLRVRRAACQGKWTRESECRTAMSHMDDSLTRVIENRVDIPRSIPRSDGKMSRPSTSGTLKQFSAKARMMRKQSIVSLPKSSLGEESVESEHEDGSIASSDVLYKSPSPSLSPPPAIEKSEESSVEALIDVWFESIPDPDLNVGSTEIFAVYSALRNRMVGKLIQSLLLDKLQDRSLVAPGPDGSSSIGKYHHGARIDISSTDVSPILRAANYERPFSQSDSIVRDMRAVECVYDFLLCQELNAWDIMKPMDISTIITLSNRDSLKGLFMSFLHEYRLREFLQATKEELHYAEDMVFDINTPRREYTASMSNNSAEKESPLGAIAQAVLNEYNSNDTRDKRLLLLHEFLEFQRQRKASHINKDSLGSSSLLPILLDASSWISMLPVDWSTLFSSGVPSCALHPVTYLRSIVAMERRNAILEWQNSLFQHLCSLQTDVVETSEEGKSIDDNQTFVAPFPHLIANLLDSDDSKLLKLTGTNAVDRMEKINSDLGRCIMTSFGNLRDLYVLFTRLQNDNKELQIHLNSTPEIRRVKGALQVINWLLAGIGAPDLSFESDREDELSGLDVIDWSDVDRCMSVLDRVDVATHCYIPLHIREKLLSYRLQCVGAVCEKYLVRELGRSADGTLRENCGRQQMFIDLASAFSELSLLITEMACEGAICDDKYNDTSPAQKYINYLMTGIDNQSSENRADHIVRRQKLVDVGKWALKLQMALMTESWSEMDDLISPDKRPDALPSCPGAISSFCTLGEDIKAHNLALERIEEHLCYNGRFTTIYGESALLPVGIDPDDTRPYFYFINFPLLEHAIQLAEEAKLVESDELSQKVCISKFLIRLKSAIDANKCELTQPIVTSTPLSRSSSDVLMRFTREASDISSTRNISSSSIDSKTVTDNQKSTDENISGMVDDGSTDVSSVSFLLLHERPESMPRHISVEVQRVEREFQNQQVEVRLVAGLAHGQDYLESEKFSAIDTQELEDVVDIASSVRQRSQRTSLLFESAQKVLNLRRGLKLADWTSIRCWLSETSDLAPEAMHEVAAIQRMSEANIRMHESLTEAMRLHRISGSYMTLDTTNTNIVVLLSALRAASSSPKLSAEDKQIVYSAECLKAVRISILMADYCRLVQETENIELRNISPCALDELLLVKRAISFFETLKRISDCLYNGLGRARPGMFDTQQLSLFQLNSALASVDPKLCSDSIKFFLANASAIRGLRAAMKGGRWGTNEAADTILECIAREEQRESKFSTDVDSQSSNIWAATIDSDVDTADRSVFSFERLGIALEHLGRRIRKLDYGKEILGGDWKRETSGGVFPERNESEVLNRSHLSSRASEKDFTISVHDAVQSDNNFTGLSSLLSPGVISAENTTRIRDVGKFKSQYRDIPHREIYFSACLGAQCADEESVASLLGNLPSELLLEVETEILQIRDELYHRIVKCVLERGFLRPTSDKLVSPVSIPESPANRSLVSIPIERAIRVARHLGIKSEPCARVYYTALVISDLRKYLRIGDVQMVMHTLGRVRSLKGNDMFASIAASEIEDAFVEICDSAVKRDLVVALDSVLPTISYDEEWKHESSLLPSAALLRKALRGAEQTCGINTSDRDIKILKHIGESMLQLRSAVLSGVVSAVQNSYDDARKLLEDLRMSEHLSASYSWVLDRLEKELSQQRRQLVQKQLHSPFSATGPSAVGTSLVHNLKFRRGGGWIDDSLSVVSDTKSKKSASKKSTATIAAPGHGYAPVFHGQTLAVVGEGDDDDYDSSVGDDTCLVEMIETVVAAHSSNQPRFHGRKLRGKDDRYVFVRRKGDFQIHLERVACNSSGDFTITQRLASAILLVFLSLRPGSNGVPTSPTRMSSQGKKTSEVAIKADTGKRLSPDVKSSYVFSPSKQRGARSGMDLNVLPIPLALLRLSVKLLSRPGTPAHRTGLALSSQATLLDIGEYVEMALLYLTTDIEKSDENRLNASHRLSELEKCIDNLQSTSTECSMAAIEPLGHSEEKRVFTSEKRNANLICHPALKYALRRVQECKSMLRK